MNETCTQATLYLVSDVLHHPAPKQREQEELYDRFYNSFGVADARELVERAFRRPQNAATQLLLLRVETITSEAQNALLKLFEEPPVSTCLALYLVSDANLLPTLRSRLQVVETDTVSVLTTYKEFDAFLSATVADRMQTIEQAHKKKDVVWQRSIKHGLIDWIEKAAIDNVQDFSMLEFIARCLLTRGASNKMLLEHLALVLPASASREK